MEASRPTARPVVPLEPRAWGRVLAVRLDNVGDVVMLGPALRALRGRAPAATITLLASPAGAAAARLLPWVDEVIAVRAPWQELDATPGSDPGSIAEIVDLLRPARFDAVFIFTSFSQSPWPPAFAAYLAGIPIRVGQAADFGGALLTHVVDPLPEPTHQVDRNAHLLEGIGMPVVDRRLELRLPRGADDRATALLGELAIDGPFVLAAPGASCGARRVPADRLAPGLAGIRADLGLPVVVTGAERERELTEGLARDVGGVSIAGRTDLGTLAALIARAALVVTAHSAPMHLADAAGTPLVVAFSGTDLEAHWRPRRSPAVLLRRETPCAPCHRLDCPYGTPCLEIDPEALVAAARAVRPDALDALGRPGARPRIPQRTEIEPWTASAS